MPENDPAADERGQRIPPPRVPPTAVGTATPEPPGRRPPRPRFWLLRWRTWIASAILLIVAGSAVIVLSHLAALRAVGWTLVMLGIATVALRVWVGIAPAIALRRRSRWIRARQAAVGPRHDHPPNER